MIPSKEYGEPHRRYIDPDRLAGECDDQLPLISKIGRGPRGHGVTPRVRTDQPGEYVVEFVDDVTGEVVLSTANLSAGEVSVSVDEGHSPVAGETVMATIHVRHGDRTQDYSLPIPPGATGSLFYEVAGEVAPTEDGTYRVEVEKLASWGNLNRPSRPYPRVNDMVVFPTPTGFAFGTIEAVEGGMAVFTSRTGYELPEFGVTENGHLTVGGKDTGVSIVGPQGPEGPEGPEGPQGPPNGLSAVMTVGEVLEGDEPKFSVRLIDKRTNTYSIDVTLPKGSDGTSINVNAGVYKISDLPPFDDTPVNDAFVVSDYEESSDHRYDLYIRGKEPVVAEEGGPWTVVEDWQGVQGFSTRALVGYSIDRDEPIRISKEIAPSAFVPNIDILDGDLCVDGTRIGMIGSAADNSGDYTVTYVNDLSVYWDYVLDKPTDLVHQPALDAETKARQDADQQLQSAISALPTTNDLTSAVAAEAAARQKQDGLLQDQIDAKLQPDDLAAGTNVTIDTESQPGKVVISAFGGGGGDYPGSASDADFKEYLGI